MKASVTTATCETRPSSPPSLPSPSSSSSATKAAGQRRAIRFGLVFAFPLACGLAACDRPAAKGPMSGDPAKVVMASVGPSSSNPLPGVIPLDDTIKAPKSNSPADGTTAVGGLTSNNQGSGGGATGSTSAKTGGDGK